MAGIRDTQLAPRNPFTPKKSETPRRGDGLNRAGIRMVKRVS
jgi:hypothetical protein